MNCILDTSTLLWTLIEPGKLSNAARKVISDPGAIKHVSTISFLEISIKMSIGKLKLGGFALEDIPGILYDSGTEIIVLDPFEAIALKELPVKENHRDPFDRMIVTQAIERNLTLISGDKTIRQYRDDGLSLIW